MMECNIFLTHCIEKIRKGRSRHKRFLRTKYGALYVGREREVKDIRSCVFAQEESPHVSTDLRS